MEFLCKWLIKHPDVEVRLRTISHFGDCLQVHMVHDNGMHIKRLVDENMSSFMEIIFNELYSQLIAKGGTV